MRFCRGLVNWPDHIPATVAAIGNFDGLHLGHQQLLNALKKQSEKWQVPSVVVLFEPHPKEFFCQDNPPARLLSLREKLELLAQAEVDWVLCLRFNQDFSNLSAAQFVDQIIENKIKIKELIVGEDFGFGHQRCGSIELLKQHEAKGEFSLQVIPDYIFQEEKVSSTRVRSEMMSGNFAQVKVLLGRPYRISGKVIFGAQRGRQLGFPTANIALKRRISPVHGVYAVVVILSDGRRQNAVVNVGTRPTFCGHQFFLEAHLFDWDQKLYGQRISIEFIEKIRDEQRFSSVAELSAQIQKDILAAKKILQSPF